LVTLFISFTSNPQPQDETSQQEVSLNQPTKKQMTTRSNKGD
jgi:hypothetical protein